MLSSGRELELVATSAEGGQIPADLNRNTKKEAHVESVPAVTWIQSDVTSDTITDYNARRFPSVFGRLVSVALRSAEPGTLQDGSADSISAVGSAQREAHRAAFDQWLSLALARQLADLEVYASWSGSDVKAVLGQWLNSERLRKLMPQDVSEAERSLFLGDLEILRQLSEKGS